MNNPAPSTPSPTVLLHVFPSFGFGGQQARFAALAHGLGEKFSHHVAALDGNFSAQSLVSDQISVQYSDFSARKSSGISLSNLAKFRKLLNDVRPDILCTYNWGSFEAVLANRLGANIAHIHFEDGFGPDETIARPGRSTR